jgi:hypothetical protein
MFPKKITYYRLHARLLAIRDQAPLSHDEDRGPGRFSSGDLELEPHGEQFD